MPINNGSGRVSIGRDTQVVLVGQFGRVDIPNVTHFDCKQETATIKSDRLDGVQINGELPKGWTLRIEADRAGADLDRLFATQEAAWYDAGTVAVATLYQYVTEPDGSASTFQFDNVALKYDDPGDWKSDALVKQRISGRANRRLMLT